MGTATQLIEEGTRLYNKGDVEGYCSLYSDDVVLTTPDGRFEGRESVQSYMGAFHTAFPELEVSLGRRAEDSEGTYLGEFSVRGTNTGPLAAPDGTQIPATGKQVEVRAVEVARVQDGRIVQHDLYWDNAGFLTQLGLLPQS